MKTIDLNSDVGEQAEGSNLDEQIFPFISSANIACGGHAGDENSIRRTIELALENNVAIGAHPGFPDKENFGRVNMEIENQRLLDSLIEQLEIIIKVCSEFKTQLHHVKPHGALYNLAAKSEQTSKLVLEAMKFAGLDCPIYGLAHSETEKQANEINHKFIGEGFADRAYTLDRKLKSRSLEGSVLHEVSDVLSQVENLTLFQKVKSEGEEIQIQVQTICLHSDTKGAVNLARQIHNHLVNKGIKIAAI